MKRLQLNDTLKQDLIEDFKRYVNKLKHTGNIINYSAEILENTLKDVPKAHVNFTTTAYLKMMMYVRDTSTEIAWHGTVEKTENGYNITDVMLYPQKLSGATVDTDQEEYQNWIIDLDDDTANKLRFQGHSHVNMLVRPSGTDMQYYEDIVQTLEDNDFYIFAILNKQGDITLFIYDLEKNIVYETEDIVISISDNVDNGDNLDISREIDLEKEVYCKRQTTINNYPKLPNNSMMHSKTPKSDRTYYESLKDDTDMLSYTDSIFTYLDKKYPKGAKR